MVPGTTSTVLYSLRVFEEELNGNFSEVIYTRVKYFIISKSYQYILSCFILFRIAYTHPGVTPCNVCHPCDLTGRFLYCMD